MEIDYYSDLKVKLRQLDLIVEGLAIWEQTLTPKVYPPLHRWNTILHLISALRQFAEGEFVFLFTGLGLKSNELPNPNYPIFADASSVDDAEKVKIVADTLTKIEEDITAIKLAIRQRIPDDFQGDSNPLKAALEIPGHKGATLPVDPAFLKMTDNLAGKALWPNGQPDFRKKGTLSAYGLLGGRPTEFENTEMGPYNPEESDFQRDFRVKTVITYVHHIEGDDSLKVRIVPYAQVALVGMPTKVLEDKKELLAIPHEIGHFLFWYAYLDGYKPDDSACGDCGNADTLINGGEPYRNSREREHPYPLPPSPYSWDEEIFADVYGALIGGPLSAIQRQDKDYDKQKDKEFNDLESDTHPTPFLRPLIYLKAMRQFPNELAKEINQSEMEAVVAELLARWNSKLSPRFTYDEGLGQIVGSDKHEYDLKMSPMSSDLNDQNQLDKSILKALKTIQELRPELCSTSSQGWGWSKKDVTKWENAGQLEREMLTVLEHLLKSAPDIKENLSPIRYNPSGFAPDIPPLWLDWALNAKQYLTAGALDPSASPSITKGSFSQMEWVGGKTPDRNIWMRIWGSGGWATKGPCTSRG